MNKMENAKIYRLQFKMNNRMNLLKLYQLKVKNRNKRKRMMFKSFKQKDHQRIFQKTIINLKLQLLKISQLPLNHRLLQL